MLTVESAGTIWPLGKCRSSEVFLRIPLAAAVGNSRKVSCDADESIEEKAQG